MTSTKAGPVPITDRLWRHSSTRIVVFDEFKIAFLPVPKSGCTSMLWTLADLAGLTRATFRGSRQPEVTRAMAVHDMTRWPEERRWDLLPALRRQEIVEADDWLRLTIVRDPGPRLWSAWQSKILLQEPRFVTRFSRETWFPQRIRSASSMIEAFRAFVHALPGEDAPHDAHWGSQSGLVAGFAPTWVGHAEQPDASMARLRDHLAEQGADATLLRTDVPRENANPVPYHPGVYDAATAGVVADLFADDFAQWSYPPPDSAAAGFDAWSSLADEQIDLVNELVERHRRIGELLNVASAHRRRAERAETALADLKSSRSWRVTSPIRRLSSFGRKESS